ncbi:MAG: class I SAM-dependent methyltransferase, partial [Dehalococcoidia bacterium]
VDPRLRLNRPVELAAASGRPYNRDMDAPSSVLRPTDAQALADWAALIDADAAQVARVREPEPAADHYAAMAARFRPGQLPSLELPVLETFTQPTDTWLDIGAGGGRFAVPLARRVARVIAVEPSASMRDTLASAAADAGVSNIEIHDLRWPVASWSESGDVSLAAHSLYDIREIAPFLDAMERYTRRLCIAVFGQAARGASLAPLFEAVHGEPLQTLPALREFVALLGARGRRYEVHTVGTGSTVELTPPDEAYEMARRMLWLTPDSAKDGQMRTLMQERWGQADGIAMPAARPFIGIVSWEPPGSRSAP